MSSRTARSRPFCTPRSTIKAVAPMKTVCHKSMCHGLPVRSSKKRCTPPCSTPVKVPMAVKGT